jgi:hypothetical protein
VVNVSIGRYGKWTQCAARDRCVWTQRFSDRDGPRGVLRKVSQLPDRYFRADNKVISPIKSVPQFALFNMTAGRKAVVLNA